MQGVPKISLVIPVFNAAPHLQECLDSVLRQSFGDWECVCVNDGSTDGSAQILDRQAASDPRVSVAHIQNRGASYARNRGIELSRGDCLMFVDADDVLEPQILEKCYEAMIKHSADLATCWWRHCDGQDVKARLAYCVSDQPGQDWLNRRVAVHNAPWAKLISRRLLSSLRFPEELSCMNDVWFVAALMLTCRRLVVLPDVLYSYRSSETSLSRPATLEKWQVRVECAYNNALKLQETAKRFDLTPADTRKLHSYGGYLNLFCLFNQVLSDGRYPAVLTHIAQKIERLSELGVLSFRTLPLRDMPLYVLCVKLRMVCAYRWMRVVFRAFMRSGASAAA